MLVADFKAKVIDTVFPDAIEKLQKCENTPDAMMWRNLVKEQLYAMTLDGED